MAAIMRETVKDLKLRHYRAPTSLDKDRRLRRSLTAIRTL
jgi:hypothetical protein